MRTRNVLLSVLVGLGVASCGENPPPSTTDKPALTNPKPYGEAPPAPSAPQVANRTPVAPPTHADATSASPIPMSDAQWTISCDTIDGPAHVAEAELRKSQLKQASRMLDWYAIHGDIKSEIYYGHYGALTNSTEKKRQENDRAHIVALLDRLGNPMVRGAVLTPVTLPDPVAPADWNLLNTPPDAYWTIEFVTFVDGPDLRAAGIDRKQAAIEMVRHYREQEHKTNIYYYHGSTVSSVCVGAWKRGAMAEQGTGVDNKGQMREDGHTDSADTSLMVFAGLAPANIPSRTTDPHTGSPMVIEGLKREVVDPDMKAAMVEYHDILVNGHQQMQDNGGGQSEPLASSIIQIPHGQTPAKVTDDNWRLAGGQSTPPVQPRQQSAGDDVLRSIGGH